MKFNFTAKCLFYWCWVTFSLIVISIVIGNLHSAQKCIQMNTNKSYYGSAVRASILLKFAWIHFNWNCYIYYTILWEKLILISQCYNWFCDSHQIWGRLWVIFALCTVPPFVGRASIWQWNKWKRYLTVWARFNSFFSNHWPCNKWIYIVM